MVVSEGRVTATIPRADATQEAIMAAAVPRSGRHRAGEKAAA